MNLPSTPRRARAGVFAQLVLVLALVLVGALLLALLLGRELASGPAAARLLRATDRFADLIEALDRHEPAQLAQRLRDAGFATRTTPPDAPRPRFAPLLFEVEAQAALALGAGREVQVVREAGGVVLWLKPATAQPLWVAFADDRRGVGLRRFTVLMLLGVVLLVWLAAALVARRLVVPLRRLAEVAPGIARGETLPEALPGAAPREVAELAQALARTSAGVRAAAEERRFVLAGVSHDLRTPLMRVQYAVELLPDTDPALRAGIERDIEEIDAILSQFIAYARDGRDEAVERIDLADLCRSAVSAARGDWQVNLPARAPLHGRPMALLRAVENLVVNAQRHGAPPFALTLARDGDVWRVEVADCGPGLSAADAQRVREAFVHDSRRGGSGLGLAIVERVARQHGGELQLLPNTPQGLRARLCLPATSSLY